MSSIALSIVDLAAGAVFNNVCDHIAARLKHGDCTEEKCRELIVRELDEINSKLDGLARKDLQSSVCFLKDGLCSLNYTFDHPANENEPCNSPKMENKSKNLKECELDNDEESPFTFMESNEDLRSQISSINKALAYSPQTVTSKERFIAAKSCFEKAYTKATEAFNNEALSTTERILATKLRVVSKILQCLEDPELGMAFSKLCLQQLHDLPAIRKRFAVFFRSQVKSHLHKRKRVENIRCVMEINYTLYEYAKLCGRTGLKTLSSWPAIELRKKAFNPLLIANKVLKKVEKCGTFSPNQFLFKEINCSDCVAVNSKGDIVMKSKEGRSLEVFSNNGEVLSSLCFDSEDNKRNGFEIVALTTDLDDSVYAVTRHKDKDAFCYTLHVFATNLDRVKQQVSLECLTGPGESHHSVCIAVDENNDIYITKQDDAKVFILDHNGNPKSQFVLQGWNLIKDMKISAQEDVIAAELVGKTVGVYSKDGELKQDIVIPGLHKVCGVAFDCMGNTIIVLVEILTGCLREFRLENYSQCGELLQTLVLPRQKETGGYHITSHPNGPLAVVHKTGVIFLHN